MVVVASTSWRIFISFLPCVRVYAHRSLFWFDCSSCLLAAGGCCAQLGSGIVNESSTQHSPLLNSCVCGRSVPYWGVVEMLNTFGSAGSKFGPFIKQMDDTGVSALFPS
uniref:Uncharacterized protein n=1 Tax=Setaria italica TaxID=4555 RepID=K3ZKE8_SETIT